MSQQLDDTKTLLRKAKKAFYDAKNRCTNPKHKRWSDWGGRGIAFNFTSFDDFLAEVGLPGKEDTLDRIENDGHYEAGNLRWTTRLQQQHNKRVYQKNRTGVSGVREVRAKGLVTETWQAYTTVNKKFVQLYAGPSFEEAVAARTSFNLETYLRGLS